MLAMVNYHHDHWSNRAWPYWLGICAVAALLAEFEFGWLKALPSFLYKWQTLTAGAIALSAAWLTVRTIRQQIELQQSQIDEDKRRYENAQLSKNWVARVGMPDALSALCEYTESCVAYLRIADDDRQIPDTPAEAISVIKSSIEYVDPVSAHKLFELITHYQVHNARLSRHTEQNDQLENDIRICDTVKLRFLLDQLFEYARNEVDVVPDVEINRDGMVVALRGCVGFAEYAGNEETFAGVRALINMRYPQP